MSCDSVTLIVQWNPQSVYCFAVNIQEHWVKSNVLHIICKEQTTNIVRHSTISKAIDKAAAQDGLSDNIIIIIITNRLIREDFLYYKCIRNWRQIANCLYLATGWLGWLCQRHYRPISWSAKGLCVIDTTTSNVPSVLGWATFPLIHQQGNHDSLALSLWAVDLSLMLPWNEQKNKSENN